MYKTLTTRARQIYPMTMGVILALVASCLFILLAGGNPLDAIAAMLKGSFGSLKGFSETLVKATPLILVGLATCIAFRGGVFNIGGEGQIILGGLAATAVAVGLDALPGIILFPLSMLAGVTAGAVWGGIAGYLRAKLMVNEVLSTIMLNVIAAQLANYLLNGPMIDPWQIEAGTRIPISSMVPESTWIPRILSSFSLHWGFLIALLMAVVVYLLFWKTTIGFNIRAVGLNPNASRKAGIPLAWYQTLVMILSGALAGLAGVIDVLAVNHRMIAGSSGNYGFTGIVAALFSGLHPLGTIPSSILLGGLLVGGDKMQRMIQIPSSLVLAMLGMIILIVVASKSLRRRKAGTHG